MPRDASVRRAPTAVSRTHWAAFFIALSASVMLGHELTHHMVARGVCGAWGTMTLSTFRIADGCDTRPWWIATAAGPLLTYALVNIGARWRHPVGLALVFANIPMGRIVNVATKSGDELVVGRALFGETFAWPAMILIAALLLGPALWTAARRLPARRRLGWFAAAMVVPTLWDFTAKRMVMGALLPEAPLLLGVPVAILLFFGAMLAASALLWPRTARD